MNKWYTRSFSYLEVFQLIKSMDFRGIDTVYFHDKDFFSFKLIPKMYLTIKFPSTIFFSHVKIDDSIDSKGKQILRKYIKRQFGDFSVLDRERKVVFESKDICLEIDLFMKGNLILYRKSEDKKEKIWSFNDEFDSVIRSISEIPSEIEDVLKFSKDSNLLEDDIKKKIVSKINKIFVIPRKVAAELYSVNYEDLKNNLYDFFENKYKSISKGYFQLKNDSVSFDVGKIKSIINDYKTNKEISKHHKKELSELIGNIKNLSIIDGEIEFNTFYEAVEILYSAVNILENKKDSKPVTMREFVEMLKKASENK